MAGGEVVERGPLQGDHPNRRRHFRHHQFRRVEQSPAIVGNTGHANTVADLQAA